MSKSRPTQSICVFETQFAPDNYMGTHSLLFTVDVYTETGVMATVMLNKQWTVQAAIHAGADMAPWYEGAVPTGMFGVRWVSCDNMDSVYTVLNAINNAEFQYFDERGVPAGHHNYNIIQTTWQHKFNDCVHTKTEAYYMWERNAAVGGTPSIGPFAFNSGGGLGRALILGLFTFIGMESPLSASGEVADPARTIPRGLLLAMVPLTLLYFSIQAVAQGILGPALAQSQAPLADAMARIHPSLRLPMLAGAGISMCGWLASDILGSPRIVFAFARDGMLPRALGRVHPGSHAPHVAILAYAALTCVLALTGTFAELAVLSTLAVAVVYIGGCAAAWRLARLGVARAGAPLGFRWLGLAAGIGIVTMLAMIALASRAEILGLLALMGVSVAAYGVAARLRAAG